MVTKAKKTKKPPTATKTEQNIAILRRYIELENKRDYRNIEKLFHPTQYTCPTWFGSSPINPKAHTRMLRGLFNAYPDWRMTVNEIISATDDSVVALITGRGTQLRTFMGRPPDDHQIATPLVHTIRIADGKIIEYRSTNPFEDPFRADVVAPDDVQAVRAQQGISAVPEELIQDVAEARSLAKAGVEKLRSQFDDTLTQCQALLDHNMRRCAMQAVRGSIYCAHHQKYGYGLEKTATA
jgi:Predicted ester cyclase